MYWSLLLLVTKMMFRCDIYQRVENEKYSINMLFLTYRIFYENKCLRPQLVYSELTYISSN